MKIGILLVATNKYIQFLDPFIESCEKYFLPSYEKKYFIYSNHLNLNFPKSQIINIEHIPFPAPTLYRYHYFLSSSEYLQECDFLFYSDVDMRFVSQVGEEVLGNLTAVIHPGFYNKSSKEYSYERRPTSTAFIPMGQGKNYFAGGFQGGLREPFLNMCSIIKNNIDIDNSKGLVAIWHDESHFNKYMLNSVSDFKSLDPGYCYPESWSLPFAKKLLALDKNHAEVRN
jgi:histo-blood group ABO system transferase